MDHVIEHEKLTDGNKKLVGLYQEVRLSEDQSGGEDGMWFLEAVEKVVEDANAVIEYVAAHWPHGKVTLEQIRKHVA